MTQPSCAWWVKACRDGEAAQPTTVLACAVQSAGGKEQDSSLGGSPRLAACAPSCCASSVVQLFANKTPQDVLLRRRLQRASEVGAVLGKGGTQCCAEGRWPAK